MPKGKAQIPNRRSEELKAVFCPASIVTVGDLDYADICFTGHGDGRMKMIGVELKTMEDLVGCIMSGRLADHQIPGMVESYDEAWLVVEGVWRVGDGGAIEIPHGFKGWRKIEHGRKTPWMYRDVMNWVHTIEMQAGMRFWRTSSREETASWLAGLYWWWQKGWSEHKGLKVFREMPRPALLIRPNLISRVVKEVDGVAWERAMEIGRTFGSVREMVNATEKEYEGIRGVGKTTARKIAGAWAGR